MRFSRLPLLAFLSVLALSGCQELKQRVVLLMTPDYEAEPTDGHLQPIFEGLDADRERIAVRLTPFLTDVAQVTDIQFAPAVTGVEPWLVVLQKTGEGRRFALDGAPRGTLFTVPVVTGSEQGLLGLAFHPRFVQNGRFFVNATVRKGNEDVSQVQAWSMNPLDPSAPARPGRVILEVVQPYPNHNAGQLAFGPDGMLYVGWGDGGWRNDPHGHGQNRSTLLGAMLRIDVDREEQGRAYAIPRDNPFVGQKGVRPEIWAWGFRNPWRYGFAPDGRLVVADVGQDAWEEIDIVVRGGNYGWNIREGNHCFEPKEDCPAEGLADPIYEYGRDEGQSITGGYVYAGTRIPALRNLYVFGDFVSGRLWAIPLPADGAPVKAAFTLAKWPILVSTFGRDPAGELYVADFASATIFRLDPGD